MPSFEQNSHSVSGTERADRPTIPQLVDLHDENKKLREALDKVQADYDLLNAYIAMSNTKLNNVSQEDKTVIALRYDMTTALVTSRLKRAKLKFEKTRRELCEHARRLEETTVAANETSFGHVPSRSQPKPSSRRLVTTSNAVPGGSRVRSNRREELEVIDSESGQSGDEEKNILISVKSRQLPDDDVVVDVDGKRLTLQQLVQWFGSSDMEAESRKVFESKSIEINEKRRLRARQ